MINLQWDKPELLQCQQEFNNLPAEQAIFMSQYDLIKVTNITDPTLWTSFLADPRVMNYIERELAVFQQAQQRKLIEKATKGGSVGTAQLLNALDRIDNKNSTKDGPVFVYCYIPLNKNEQQSPNVKIIHRDIFEESEDY